MFIVIDVTVALDFGYWVGNVATAFITTVEIQFKLGYCEHLEVFSCCAPGTYKVIEVFIHGDLLGCDLSFTVEHFWRFIKTTFKASNYTVSHIFESELS